MYKVGDKVETKDNYYKKLNGVVVKDNYPKEYNQVRVKYSLEFEETIENDFLIKQKSAHEKLIEMGYEVSHGVDILGVETSRTYRHYDDDVMINVFPIEKKIGVNGGVTLTLSRILTQYLEELEGE